MLLPWLHQPHSPAPQHRGLLLPGQQVPSAACPRWMNAPTWREASIRAWHGSHSSPGYAKWPHLTTHPPRANGHGGSGRPKQVQPNHNASAAISCTLGFMPGIQPEVHREDLDLTQCLELPGGPGECCPGPVRFIIIFFVADICSFLQLFKDESTAKR